MQCRERFERKNRGHVSGREGNMEKAGIPIAATLATADVVVVIVVWNYMVYCRLRIIV